MRTERTIEAKGSNIIGGGLLWHQAMTSESLTKTDERDEFRASAQNEYVRDDQQENLLSRLNR